MRGIFPSVFRDPFPRWAGGRPSDGRTEAEVSCYRILCIHVSAAAAAAAATAAEKCRIGSQLPRSIADGRTDSPGARFSPVARSLYQLLRSISVILLLVSDCLIIRRSVMGARTDVLRQGGD